MSDGAAQSRAPTIILVGGSMELDGGAALDSRQSVEDDPWSLVAHRALTGSSLWWTTVLSFATPVLAGAGNGATCFVVGGQVVKELRSDGAITQRKLRSLLPGKVTLVKMDRPWELHPLPPDFVPMDRVGYHLGDPDARWRLEKIDQPPYTVASHAAAAPDHRRRDLALHQPWVT